MTSESFLDDFDWMSLLPPNHPARRSVLTHTDLAEHNRKARQLMAEERWAQRQRELPAEYRQRAIDTVWEQTLEARRELEAEAARSCHVGPGDPDYRRR